MRKVKLDLYARITDGIIKSLEAGVCPWIKPWTDGPMQRPLRATGEKYSGINVIILWMQAEAKGYTNQSWMTYRQAAALGGQVRKDEKGTQIVYANTLKKKEADERTGKEAEKAMSFLKRYTVFNVEQIDGLPARFTQSGAFGVPSSNQRIETIETFVGNTGATITHGGTSAHYCPVSDSINMPELALFRDAESYYVTLLHEMVHWTKSSTRQDRNFGTQRLGDAGYALEELVAELGAAFLSADLGLALKTPDDHAAYIDDWLKVLRHDKRAIFTAASHAQRAAAHLHGLQPQAANDGATPPVGTEA